MIQFLNSNLLLLYFIFSLKFLKFYQKNRQYRSFFFFYKFILFIYYFCLRWVFVAARWLSLVAASRGYSFVAVRGLLIAVASLVAEHGLQVHGLQQLWHAASRAQAQQMWHTGLVAPRHVGSSWIRAQTRIPCIGRRIPNHCATREDPRKFY